MTTIVFINKIVSNYDTITNSLKIPWFEFDSYQTLQPDLIKRIGFIWKTTFPCGTIPVTFANNIQSKYFTLEFFEYLKSFAGPVTVDLFYCPENIFEFVDEINQIQEILPTITFNYLPTYNPDTKTITMESSGEQVGQIYFNDNSDMSWMEMFNSKPAFDTINISRAVISQGYNQSVTIYGEDFYGNIIVEVNGKVSPKVEIVSPTKLVFTVPLTGLRGLATVKISNSSGFDTNSMLLSLTEPPKINSLNVNYGPQNGGQTLIIYGTDFYYHENFYVKLNGVPAAYEIKSPTEITCFTPESQTSGLATIEINSAAGLVTSSTIYSYVGSPEITSIQLATTQSNIAPVDGPDRDIEITGKEFYGFAIRGELPQVTFNGIVLDNLEIVNPTKIKAKIPIKSRNPTIVPGWVLISISTVGGAWSNISMGTSGNIEITQIFGYYDIPVIKSITNISNGTNVCEPNTTVQLKITGTSLLKLPLQPFDFKINGISASVLNSISLTELTGTFNIEHHTEWAAIEFTNIGGTYRNYLLDNTIVTKLLYVDVPIGITEIKTSDRINKCVINTIKQITITGTNFKQFNNQPIELKLNDINCTNVQLVNSTTITGYIPSGIMQTGSAKVWLKTSNGIYQNYGQTNNIITDLFYFTFNLKITSVNPLNCVINNNSQTITIIGTDFDNITQVLMESDTCTFTQTNSTQISVNVPLKLLEQTVNISVDGPLGSDTFNGFKYVGIPLIETGASALDISNCKINTNTTLVISGTNFYNLSTVTFTNSSNSNLNYMAQINSYTSTSITVGINLPNIGIYNITVTGLYGSNTLQNGFRCWSTPVISMVTPNKISVIGGQITITGTDLDNPTLTIGSTSVLDSDIIEKTPKTIKLNIPAYVSGSFNLDINLQNIYGNLIKSNAFSYIPKPVVTSSNISIGSNNTATKIIITGTNLDQINQVTFISTKYVANVTRFTIIDSTQIEVFTPILSTSFLGKVQIELSNSYNRCFVPDGFTYTGDTYKYLHQSGTNVQESSDGDSWTNISFNNNAWIMGVGVVKGHHINYNCTVLLISDLVISGNESYFIMGANGIVFDGAGYTITVNSANAYPGLISNGTDVSSGKSNITVKNIGVLVGTNTTLKNNGGWICQEYFARGADGNCISNCYSNGGISRGAGGICGKYLGYAMMNSKLIIDSCYSAGAIREDAGGICGMSVGVLMKSSSISIISCYSNGTIGENAGGICGKGAGYNMSTNSTISISSCYSTGTIGKSAGGICGSDSGNLMVSSNISISSCYSTGTIGENAGGICGTAVGLFMSSNSTITINSCYSTGSIGEYAGGICGAGAGTAMSSSTISISSCYSTGTIGTAAGGICGELAGASMSSSTFTVSGSCASGPIYGFNADSGATESNCKTDGDTTWSYTNASAYLLGGPTNFASIGTTWTSFSTNIPWLLSAFTAEIYTPNNVTNPVLSNGTYTTGPGKFSNSDGYSYQLLTTNTDTTINTTTGTITYTGLTNASSYITPVVAYKENYQGYSIGYFKVNPQITVNSIDTNVVNVSGNTKITITGMNLENITDVTVGLISVDSKKIVDNTDFSLGVIVPAGSVGTVDIKITGKYGSITIQNGLTYTNSNYMYLRQSNKNIEYSLDCGNWLTVIFTSSNGFEILNTYTIELITDLEIFGNNAYFTFKKTGIIFDGNGHTITINNANSYPGLIRNGLVTTNNGVDTITKGFSTTIKNVGVIAGTGTYLSNFAGWVGQKYFGADMSGSTIIFDSCWSTGNITSLNPAFSFSCFGGGICGAYCGYKMNNTSNISINSCYSSGSVDSSAGGIVGFLCGFNMSESTISIDSCYSSGTIGKNAGGIIGYSAGYYMKSNSNIKISSCYSTGSIGNSAGGICGGAACGPLFLNATSFTTSSTLSIISCYSTGSIGTEAGGICGADAGWQMDSNSTISISSCYSTGTIGTKAGGICGSYAGDAMKSSTISINSCYSTGSIDSGAGGICGYRVGYQMDTISSLSVNNCYSIGNILSGANNSGPIYSLDDKNPAVTESNCYSTNGNSWSDSDATISTALTGFPAGNLGIGTTWTRVGTGLPWLLSAFTFAIYTPNYVNNPDISNQTYTTKPGNLPNSNGYTYSLLTSDSSQTINSTTGAITYTGITSANSFVSPVIAYKSNYSVYFIDTFTFNSYLHLTQSGSNIITSDGSAIVFGPDGYEITKPCEIKLMSDIEVTSANAFFNIKSNGVTFNGNGFKVTVKNVTDYPGLIRNGTATTNGYGEVNVKNIGVEATGTTTLATYGGWIGQEYFGTGIVNSSIGFEFCWSTGDIGDNSGNIVAISGGICGNDVGALMVSSSFNISSCWSTGNIGVSSGGICSFNTRIISSSFKIESCWSSGNIVGGGGICSYSNSINFSKYSSSIVIQNCYSSGECTSLAHLNNWWQIFYAGGIVGVLDSGQSIAYGFPCNINSCYTTGKLTSLGVKAYSIINGDYFNGQITNCYTVTKVLDWKDNDAIAAGFTGYPTDIIGVGPTWTRLGFDHQMFGIPIPWLLSAFTAEIYTPNNVTNPVLSNGTYTTGPGKFSNLDGYSYKLITSDTNITIDSKTGVITYTGITSTSSYKTPVLAYKPYYKGYSIGYFQIN